MAATKPDLAPDDYGLELESIAVGPYCVFDAFKPPLSPRIKTHISPRDPTPNKETMETPLISNEFRFGNVNAHNMRPPWFSTSGDDVTLAAPVDELPRGDWNEWMQWDPAASQNPELKPLHVQGPACFLKPDQRPPPLFNRRQSAQLQESSLPLSADTPTSASMTAQTAFTFGEQDELPPAFSFGGNALSTTSSAEVQQQNGYYSPPLWQQQQQQQQQVGDNSLFSAARFEPMGISTAQAPPISTPSLHHSSPHNDRTSSSSAHSSPEPAPVNSKKRKATFKDSEEGSSSRKEKHQPIKKTAHNMIEKRYRNNLNDKIAALRDSVPSLRVMSRGNGTGEEEDDPEDLEGLTPAHKLNKATVLSKATEYIRHLEKRNKRLQDEVIALTGRLDSYEKLAISGPMTLHGPVGTPDGNKYQEDPFAPPSGMTMSGPPQGMIPVPENMANLHRGMPRQQHYAPAYPNTYTSAGGRPGLSGPPLINGQRNSGMVGKLMVGSLAGLMVLEGLAERDQTSNTPSRGLFALPINLASFLSPHVSFGAGSAQLPLAKLLLIFGAIFYIVGPWLDFRRKPKKKSAYTINLAPVPSLASPVEVRRKAWLTAIQTVWVPRHTFLLEVAALGLKTLKLSTRKLIGWDGYVWLTGITREQEAARVKAWNIALDAQLTGGDAEISKSRLVLTLMASGTLPDTPALLMLKALHIRVLLWELANAGYGSWWKFDALSSKLARRYWNAARSEQKSIANMALKPNSDIEALPEHLVALLQKECDDVLVPSIIQRAYNLAWNRPSAESTDTDETMDGVVEDFTICSPLDALAAWYSSYVLKNGLACFVGSKNQTLKESVKRDLGLAAHTAPPTSQARVRALVAQAVVLDDDRSTNVTTAYEALPSHPSTSTQSKASNSSCAALINFVGDAPVSEDVWKALTLAKCYALTESSSVEAHRRAASVVNSTRLPEATMTLLSFAAGYKVLGHFIQNPLLQTESSQGLERLASSLRMWVGHETGRRSGLTNNARGRIIGHCLDASKTLVGLAEPEEIDDGYVSSSVNGD